MLQKSPEIAHKSVEQICDDDAILCQRCNGLITRGRWQISVGGHAHRFTNPMGLTFNLRCFETAPGAILSGLPTHDATWFAGYSWSMAHCGGCRTHMGWHYQGESSPPQFFGLIRERLMLQPAPSDPK